MKMYNKPEVKITLLSDVDVICTSAVSEEPKARALKTKVAGNEGANYGSAEVSIYD